MSLQFPEVLDQDFKANDYKLSKQAIDFAINNYHQKSGKRSNFDILYDAYNGVIKSKAYEYITNTYGRPSSANFVRYRLGKSKLDQMDGEFLTIGLDSVVTTTNRDAINAKMENAKMTLGFMAAKQEINGVREKGLPVYPDVEIPEMNDNSIFEALNIRSKNEVVMQTIIDDKVKSQKIRMKIGDNFKDIKIVSECFGKIERDLDGVDTYRVTKPKNAIFLESVHDPFLLRTPFIGERIPMYKHEILSQFVDLTRKDKELIDSYCSSPGDHFEEYEYEMIGDSIAIPVYDIQWKIVETVYTKIIPAKDSDEPYIKILSKEYYNNNVKAIRRDVNNGKYEIKKEYRESLMHGKRIGEAVYYEMEEKPYTIQTRKGGKRYRAFYDYVGLLFNTVNGTRVSLQEMIYDLEETYDIIMFQIRREVQKIKGMVLAYDRMGMPKGQTMESVMARMTNDGVIDFSSGDSGINGNLANERLENIASAIKPIDLGASQSLGSLIAVKADIERSMDRITGINESRQGMSKATMTATGIESNVEASRAITYEMFFYINEYAKEVLLRLAEKTKINWEWIDSDNQSLVLGDADKGFLKVTKDLTSDDYGVYLSDGRKQEEIKQRMREFYGVQINSGELRASDIAKAEMKDTFPEYVGVLEGAWATIKKEAAQQAEAQAKGQQENLKMQLEIAREDREDKQQHDKDVVVLKGEVDKEKELLRGESKSKSTTQEAKNKMLGDERKAEIDQAAKAEEVGMKFV